MNEVLGFLLVVSIVCGAIFGVNYAGFKHEEAMANLGYIEVQGVGTPSTLWVKP